MPWALLLDLRVILGAALIAMGIYAKIQTVRLDAAKAEFAQYKADVESEAAKAKVLAAREEARRAQNAQEVLDGLQARYTALNARYRRLQHATASSGPVPALSDAAALFGTCPGDAGKPDPTAGRLAEIESRITGILETGDREIAKYVELWRLQEKNSANPL